MAKVQILFSKGDETGMENSISQNISNHYCVNKYGNEMRLKGKIYDTHVNKLRPRGKAYVNLWSIQFNNFYGLGE
ncbi:hypothetical protein [Salmonella phage SSBI34]|nr:hypothetical protein [Salmonella phage SSBI34]